MIFNNASLCALRYNCNMFKTSQRIKDLPISAVRKLTPYALKAKAEGVKVFHLNIGDPDIKTPAVMVKVLQNFKLETIRYAQSSGEPELVQAIKNYYQKLGFKNINEGNMVVTIGGSEAIMMAFYAVTNPGDEILVFEPFYSNYSSFAHLNEIKIVPIPTKIENGFHLPAKNIIESYITKKTRAILFSSPNNPTGTVFTKEEMQTLVKIARKNDLFIISDEVYREFVFDNKSSTSILEYLQQIPDQIILVDSLSKRFSLCGARIGVLVTLNKEIIAGILKIAQSRLSGGLVDQLMAARLMKVPSSYTIAVVKEYQKRRDVLYDGLLKIEGVFLTKPEGAFYTMVSLPVKEAEDFAIFLLKDFRLNNQTVMLAPGAGFYATAGQGLDQVRIAYVLKVPDLLMCIKIISEGLKAYKLKKLHMKHIESI